MVENWRMQDGYFEFVFAVTPLCDQISDMKAEES